MLSGARSFGRHQGSDNSVINSTFKRKLPLHTPSRFQWAGLMWMVSIVWMVSGIAAADEPPASAARVTAGTIDGKVVEGALLNLSTDGVEVSTATGPVKLSAATLVSVAISGNAEQPADPPTLALSLVDGTLLAATAFKSHEGVAEVRLAGGTVVKIQTKRIEWVRFHAPSGDDPLAAQWAEIVSGAAAGSPGGTKPSAAAADVLVVRKKSALDYLEGVAGEIGDDSIVFEVDHDPVTVKRAKVEGLIYYRPKSEELTEAAAVVVDRGGSRWQVARLTMADSNLELVTPAGQEVALPLSDLAKLDFSSANIQFLSDLDPDSYEFVSYFGGKDQPPALAEFYRPRRDVTFDQNPLRIDGKTFAKGLSMHARTKAVYRLPGKFSHFSAVVGIDDSVRDAGDVRLEVRGDGKMLWEANVRGTDPPLLMDVAVEGVKRLEILVDFGNDFDAGDVIDFCDAKVTR
jgi:NPCBM/NEW2 domain